MRRPLTIAVIALLIASAASAAPTAAELIDKITAKLGQIRSLEGECSSPDPGWKTPPHFAFKVVEKDGETRMMSFFLMDWSGKGSDGKFVPLWKKEVCDGVTRWTEFGGRGVNEINVEKQKALAGDYRIWCMEKMSSLKSRDKEFAYKVIGEDEIAGQKMFVLEGQALGRMVSGGGTPYGTNKITEKFWIGQDDLLIHRERRTMQRIDPKPAQEPATDVTDFKYLKVNEPVDEGLFQYVPPAGAVVKEWQ